MALIGTVALLVALIVSVISAGALLVGGALRSKKAAAASSISWIGHICVIAVFAALLVCCGILVICLMNGDNTIKYVVDERSGSTSGLAWLYKLSGLWAGRQGSLLFWAWLIAAFNAYVAYRHIESEERLDDIALGISSLVLLAFVALLFFSESNMPFIATPASYFDANGQLIGADLLGMNALLEHWAMAVHPPTLFIGYAGLTLPFAYAIATLVCGDDSPAWVLRVNGITAFAWVFLGIGIGLGAVWAYVVLGWGGYWGWDPVENASLLSWLVCTALMHSFTLYRTRGTFKRWSVVCSCFAFMFVIVGTFISRSGIVQSVHAFAGDAISLVLFVVLIVVAFAAGVLGIFVRPSWGKNAKHDHGEDEGILTKEMGYFLSNVILVVGAFVLAYLTLASAMPAWMPLGGQSMSADTYNSLARPLGIVLLLIVAIGPMMGWHRTDGAWFWRRAKVPAICAAVLFALLMLYFFVVLLPVYTANIDAGDTAAAELAALGPAWYYNGLAIVGFAVASLLVFNSGYLLMCALHLGSGSDRVLVTGAGKSLADLGREAATAPQDSLAANAGWRVRASTIGGMLAHAALGIILIGLIGSSMYVTEHSGYLAASSTSSAAQEFTIQDYSMTAVDVGSQNAGGDGYLYSVVLDITKGGQPFAQAKPIVQVNPSTMEQKLMASVISTPLQDVFVVFRGVNADDDFSLDVRINPLISFVWVGFVLLVLGTALGCVARRPARGLKDRD